MTPSKKNGHAKRKAPVRTRTLRAAEEPVARLSARMTSDELTKLNNYVNVVERMKRDSWHAQLAVLMATEAYDAHIEMLKQKYGLPRFVIIDRQSGDITLDLEREAKEGARG